MSDRDMRVVEMHYTTTEVAVLLRRSERWVREKIQAGEFDPVYKVDGDFLVAASGVNAYLVAHAYHYDLGVKARNLAELKRRTAGRCLSHEAAGGAA